LIYFVKFIYQTFFLPPGVFIILMIVAAIFLMKKKSKLWILMLAFACLLYSLSIPLVGNSLIRGLENKYSPPASIDGDVIVMLGGGSTLDTPNVAGKGHLTGYSANRLLTCAQLYNKLKVPIIISGGKVDGITGADSEVGKEILLQLGVPNDKIIAEGNSLNTTQNARYTKELIDKSRYNRIIVVTSAFHMKRSVKQFEKVGVKVIPYPTDYQTNLSPRVELYQFIPAAEAMEKVSLSVKEYIGILISKWY